MPRRKFVASLKTNCLWSIARNMDEIWCEDYAKNFLDQGDFLYLVGPFECLTSDHVQELINILSERKWMKRYYLHLLIDNRLESLDLSVCRNVANKDSIVNLVRLRCQKIIRLNIGYCNQVSARIIADVVNSASNIQSLNLQRTKCNDQVLSQIGHRLHHLRELNVSGCPISDMGLMGLCVSFQPGAGKCTKLVRLDVSSTAVTPRGAQQAVENLPNLQLLEFPDTCDVIFRARRDCDVGASIDLSDLSDVIGDINGSGTGYSLLTTNPANSSNTTKFTPTTKTILAQQREELAKKNLLLRLRLLTMSQMREYAAPALATVRVCVLTCPYLAEVHFMRGANDECVRLLSLLEHLRVLHLGNGDEELITFDEGLLPLLIHRGASLLDLSLHEVNKIDVGAIAACCPNLKKLSILIAGYPTAQFPIHTHPDLISGMKHRPLTKLEHIKVLIHSPENTFPPQYIKLLLVNALNLRSLHLASVHALDDTVLDFILEANAFPALETCCLESCHRLSGEGVRRLIHQCRVMSGLVIKYCKEVTRQHFADYCKLCADNNYEMNIEWL